MVHLYGRLEQTAYRAEIGEFPYSGVGKRDGYQRIPQAGNGGSKAFLILGMARPTGPQKGWDLPPASLETQRTRRNPFGIGLAQSLWGGFCCRPECALCCKRLINFVCF